MALNLIVQGDSCHEVSVQIVELFAFPCELDGCE